MKCFSKIFVMVFSMTMTLSIMAAEPHNQYKVDPKFDIKFEINVDSIDVDDIIVDPKAWYHITEDELGYLRVQYTIINNADKMMYSHKWVVEVENETFSEEVITSLKPDESKTFSQLVFGGVIQKSKNKLTGVSLAMSGNYNSPLGNFGNNNSYSCPPYVSWCSAATEAMVSSTCNDQCIRSGRTGYAQCSKTTYTAPNGEKCITDTIICVCNGGNNPESSLSLPEIARDRDLDPYIRTIFQNGSSLQTRPYDNIEE